jgi:hypothetical protein
MQGYATVNETGATRMLSKTMSTARRSSAAKAAHMAGHSDIEIDFVAAL